MTSDPTSELLAGKQTSTSRRIWTVVAIVAAAIVVVNLVAQGLDRAVGGDEPGGAAGSSYATAPDGLAAFGSLLTHYGRRVTQQRGSIADDPPPETATAFVLEPSELTSNDAEALLQFVSAGGHLVVGGKSPFYLHNLSDAPPTWQPSGASSWITVDPSFGRVREIDGAGAGAWAAPGRGRTIVGTNELALVTRDSVGQGEIYYLADGSPLENAYLSSGDNAAFALALAGGADRPVVFAEGVHGYGARRGLAAIPDRWKVALVLVGVAALAFVWSRARRFGPPDRVARDLPPARAVYVNAISISLERTRDRAGALAPAQRFARERLVRRAGLGSAADDHALAGAARSFGCTDDEIDALLDPIDNDASILALGRAVARVGGGDGRMQ